MSRPIYGIPVGSSVCQSDWNQTDETKNDYIKNKPNFDLRALKDWVKQYIKDYLAMTATTITEEDGGVIYEINAGEILVDSEVNVSGGNTIIIGGYYG